MRATIVRVLTAIGALIACATAAASLGPHKAIQPADQARAKKVLLALSDLPHGWKSQPTSPNNESVTPPKCANVNLSDLTETADTERQFGQGSTGIPVVDSAVGMLKTRGQADALWQRVPNERVLSCSARSGAGLPKGSHVSFKKLTLPRIGDRSAGWRFTITTNTFPSEVSADIVFANKGRTFSVLTLADLGSSIDATLERRLTRVMAARLNRYAA